MLQNSHWIRLLYNHTCGEFQLQIIIIKKNVDYKFSSEIVRLAVLAHCARNQNEVVKSVFTGVLKVAKYTLDEITWDQAQFYEAKST